MGNVSEPISQGTRLASRPASNFRWRGSNRTRAAWTEGPGAVVSGRRIDYPLRPASYSHLPAVWGNHVRHYAIAINGIRSRSPTTVIKPTFLLAAALINHA